MYGFTDAGLACALSIPSFTTGTDFKIEALNTDKYKRFAFHCDQNVVFVEMGIKISELVSAADQNEKGIQDSETDVAGQEDSPPAQQDLKEEKKETVETKSVSDNAEQRQTSLESDESQADKPEKMDAAAESAETVEKKSQKPKVNNPSPEEKKQGASTQQTSKNSDDVDLGLLLDIPLEIKVELGRAKIPIHNLLNFGPGSAVKLLKLEGEPVDILANETLIAKGEVVVQNQK